MTNRDIINSKPRSVQIALKVCITKSTLSTPPDQLDWEAEAGKALVWWDETFKQMKNLAISTNMFSRVGDGAPAVPEEITEEFIASKFVETLRTQPGWGPILKKFEGN